MNILLVDDEPLQLLRLEKEVKNALKGEGNIVTYSNPVEAAKANKIGRAHV